MTSFFKKFLYLHIILVLLVTSAHANIPIHIMPNTGFSKLSDQLTKTNIKAITEQTLIHEHIDIGNNSRYAFAQVKFIQAASERYLLVHLMSRYYFSYQIVRINLNPDNSIKYPIIKNYHLKPDDFLTQSNNIVGVAPECPAQYQMGKPLFVIGTPAYKYYKSVSRSVDALSKAVLKTHQYQLVTLLDNNATVQNYQNILACPNLKYFFHIGGSDDYGQSFALSDGDFNATYFSQNSQLNLSDKAISFDSCNLFDQVNQGFCPILSKMNNAPLAYTAGSSQLLIYGSAETYTCFWKKVLNGALMTQSTLKKCAISHDPSVRNSQSGTYVIGAQEPGSQILVQTNQRTIIIQPNDYIVLKLYNGEMVTHYAIKNSEQTLAMICTADPTNRVALLNNPNLTAGEFKLNYQGGNTCEFSEISRMQRNGDISRDIYGFRPGKSCFKLPNKPPIGLTLSTNASFIGFVDMNCNGSQLPYLIGTDGGIFDWQTLASQFHANNLECTFNVDSTKIEIASMHLNIHPSATLPGEFSGQISNVKNMNGYPMPTITYSGKSNALGYHNGVAIVINSK